MERVFLRKTAMVEAIVLFLVIVLPVFLAEKAEAADLTKASVRLDRMQISEFTSGMVCAQIPAGNSATEIDVQVTFPTGFTVSTTTSNWTVATTDIPTDATAWPGIGTATAVSGQTVTFPSTNLTASTYYCFRWTNTSAALQNPGTPASNLTGTIQTRASGPTNVDSKSYATAIISDDQIDISATVPPTFAFSLGANSSSLGTLSSSSISSGSGVTVTIGTNAASGWVAWVKSANAALNSASTSATIATAGTVNDTPEDLDSVTGYILDVDRTTDAAGGCTLQQNPGYGDEYDGLDATQGGSLSTTFQPMAECVTGTANNDVITLTPRAKIVASQAAATDYTDTLTVVGAGRF